MSVPECTGTDFVLKLFHHSDFDLNAGVQRDLMHGHAGASGLIVAEEFSVHFVHSGEVGEVGEEDSGA